MKAPGSIEDLSPARGLVEIRYPKANRYWDSSGQLVQAIEDKLPLECQRLAEGGFEFTATAPCGTESCAFFWDKLAANLNVDAQARFDETVTALWELVREGLAIARVVRVGHRVRYVFPTESKAAAEALLGERAAWSVDDRLADFGQPENAGTVLRTVLADRDRRLRLEIAPGQLQPRNGAGAKVGVVLDLDFSMITTPAAADLNIADFLRWNRRFIKDNLHKVLR